VGATEGDDRRLLVTPEKSFPPGRIFPYLSMLRQSQIGETTGHPHPLPVKGRKDSARGPEQRSPPKRRPLSTRTKGAGGSREKDKTVRLCLGKSTVRPRILLREGAPCREQREGRAPEKPTGDGQVRLRELGNFQLEKRYSRRRQPLKKKSCKTRCCGQSAGLRTQGGNQQRKGKGGGQGSTLEDGLGKRPSDRRGSRGKKFSTSTRRKRTTAVGGGVGRELKGAR